MEKNVGRLESMLRFGFAAVVMTAASRQKGFGRWVALAAAPLIYSAVTQYCPLKKALTKSADPKLETGKSVVDETSEESFPASDPPSWTPAKA